MVLWAMSLWAAAVVLILSGFGANDLARFGLKPRRVAALGFFIWGLGWMGRQSAAGLRFSLGFAALALTSWVGLIIAGKGRWLPTALLLAGAAALLRPLADSGVHQVSLLPAVSLQSLALGLAAGLSIARPWPAALAAAAGSGLGAILSYLGKTPVHGLGQHDLAASMLAALGAWLMAWTWQALTLRLKRPA